jgi:hypothetical protein
MRRLVVILLLLLEWSRIHAPQPTGLSRGRTQPDWAIEPGTEPATMAKAPTGSLATSG